MYTSVAWEMIELQRPLRAPGVSKRRGTAWNALAPSVASAPETMDGARDEMAYFWRCFGTERGVFHRGKG